MIPARLIERWVFVALLVLLLLSSIVPAQSGRQLPKSTDKGGDDVKLGTSEVVLPITVRDEYGHLVRGLHQDDFVVLESDKRQKVSSFSVQQVPVNVVLLLDASGSVFTEIPAIREAAKQFTDRFTENDKFSVVQFADKVETLQDWTSDKSLVNHALNWKYKGGEITLFYDSLQYVCDKLLSKVNGRKIIILLTDGVDTGSKLTKDRVFNEIVRQQAVVYVVSKARVQIVEIEKQYGGTVGKITGTAGQVKAIEHELENGERLLGELADKTGGFMYSPIRNEELTKAYRDVAEEIKGQYVITYVSSNEEQDGSFRPIKIALSHAGYTVYSRQGYYAPKPAENAKP
jgi:Ca-activated chloride channel family protein